jgi:hypothetical protein
MDSKELDSLVQQHAQKAGMSSKQAKQALKKLREGGMMAQIAPQLQKSFTDINPNLTPREKLMKKLKAAKDSRSIKEVKIANYEKQKEDVKTREIKEEEEKEHKKAALKRKHKAHQLKLKELEQKLGVISEDLYMECLNRKQTNKYSHESEMHRDRNIIDLYAKQHEFKETVNMDDLDDI